MPWNILSISKSVIPFLFGTYLASFSFALAEPTFSTKYKYFEVGGTTYQDLWLDINTKGPKSNLGIGHAGYTTFKFEKNLVGIIPKNGLCQITTIEYHLTSTVLLPKWTDGHKSGQQMKILWKALFSDVKRHEDQHVEIAKQSIIELENALLKIKPNKSCKILKRKIRNTIRASEKTRSRRQNSFERKEIRGQKKRLSELVEHFQSN